MMASPNLKIARWFANIFIISMGVLCMTGKFPVALGIDLNGYPLAAFFIAVGILGFCGVNVYYGGPLDMRQDRQTEIAAPSQPTPVKWVEPPYLTNEEELKYREYLRSHPPAYIKDLAERVGPDDDTLESHFALQCPCHSSEFEINGFQEPDQDWLGSPYSVRCKSCGTEHVLLDYEIHGYDGTLCNPPKLGNSPNSTAHCQNCSGSVFQVNVMFQYCIEEKKIVDQELPDLHPEDLFSWFSATGKCAHCGQETNFADYECA